MGIQGTKGIWGEGTQFLPPDFGFDNFFPPPAPSVSPFYAVDYGLGSKADKGLPPPPFPPYWPPGACDVHVHCDMEILNDLQARFDNLVELETQQSLQVASLTTQVTNQGSQIADLIGEVADLVHIETQQSALITDQGNKIDDLTNQVAGLITIDTQLTHQVDDLTHQVDDLIHEVTDQGNQIDDLISINHTLVDEIHALEAEVGALHTELDYFIHHPPPPPLPVTQLNAALDPASTKSNGDWINGSGIPGTDVIKQEVGHAEVAQMFGWRTGDTMDEFGIDHNGVVIVHASAGTQVVDPAHNVSADHAGRGLVAIGLSFNTGANGAGGESQELFLASGGRELYNIDLDPTAGVSNLALEARYDPAHSTGSSGVVLVTADSFYFPQGTIIVNDNAGNATTFQNFTNLAFFNGLIDHDANVAGIQGGPIAPAGIYDFESVMIDANNQVIANVHSQLILS